MGQVASKVRYDAFARQRLADKLEFIQRLHPGLSQEDMAGEIEDLARKPFDRKYFGRLRRGRITDEVVHRIVRWVDAEYDPNFSDTLRTDLQFFSSAAISRHTVLSRKEWVKISREESLIMAPLAGAAFGLPEGFAEICAYDVRALSFLPGTRVIRMSLYRKGAVFSVPLFLLERDGKLTALTSLQQLTDHSPVVDTFTMADIAAFYFECVDAARRIDLFASTLDLTYHLHSEQGLHIAAAASVVAEKMGTLFEPPMIQELSDRYALRIDAGTNGEYRRLLIEITDTLDFTLVSDQLVAQFPDKSSAGAVEYVPASPGIFASLDIEPVLALLREVPTGRLLVRVLELRPAPVITVPGPKEKFVYDEHINVIVHTRCFAQQPQLEHTALALASCLRFLDQFLLNLTYPDPMIDPRKYATTSHGKNMDAIVHVCKIAIELQQTARGSSALKFIEAAGFAKIFDAVRRGASDEEVFDAYASS